MSETNIIRCPHCGKQNRVRASPQGVPQCGICHHKLPWLVEADAQSFDAETRASVPVLVDFWAPWCAPCQMVAPVLERIAQSHAGEIKVVKLNTEQEPAIAQRFGVRGIPTLVLMRDGREIDRRTGALPERQLADWLQQQALSTVS